MSSAKDVIRIEVGLSIGLVNDEQINIIEYPHAVWYAMTDEERESAMAGELEVHVANHLDSWVRVLGDEDTEDGASDGE